MNFSDSAFLLLAFSTISIILLIVESLKSFVTFTSRTPAPFKLPLKTSLFTATSAGTDSPVRAAVFKSLSPFTTIPSTGTFSPDFIIMISPTFYFFGEIFTTSPFLSLIFA